LKKFKTTKVCYGSGNSLQSEKATSEKIKRSKLLKYQKQKWRVTVQAKRPESYCCTANLSFTHTSEKIENRCWSDIYHTRPGKSCINSMGESADTLNI